MVRDDHSGYACFYLASKTDFETVANALLDWSAALGVPLGLMSDYPSHVNNETLSLLVGALRTPHHFTLPNCPCSNGAVERLGNKELLRVTCTVQSEFQMRHDNRPQVMPLCNRR